MSLNAATIEFLLAKGLTGEDLLEVARRQEVRRDPTAPERMARYRQRQAERRNVTRSPNEVSSNPDVPSETEVSSGVVKRASKGIRIPEGWVPQRPYPPDILEMLARWPPERKERELNGFRDYWLARNRDAARTDWDRTWWNRIRDRHDIVMKAENGRAQRTNGLRGSRPDPALDMWREANDEIEAERRSSEDHLGTRLALPPVSPS
jgi:hypothetical protein